MPREFLIPENHTKPEGHYFDPYSSPGARSILRRFRDDVIEMLEFMLDECTRYPEGKVMLNQSPLRKKVWVAAAMKTLGLVEERPTSNGTCGLVLTNKAIDQMAALRKYL